ncbi:MAG: HAMP domain-containing sensor histidine kinase [Potamolinea sp.]
MFIPASSEFVALCKSQVAVLTQGLGAASGAVYLTEELREGTQPKLIPVVVYPEASVVYGEDDTDLVLPELRAKIDKIPRPMLLPQASENNPEIGSTSAEWEENYLQQKRQIVLPLIHEGVVMGLLVTTREDRPWNEKEKATIERIVLTLTIAYIMDQRRAWYEQQLSQQRLWQAQQHDHLDDLLHQFRNPLTAVRTFGKLLMRRFLPGDKNREAASSIVRESDRLQELLQEFDASLDMSQEDVASRILSHRLEASQEVNSNSQPELATGGLQLLPGNFLTTESFSVPDVLEPLLVSASAIAQENNLELRAEISPKLPLVKGNAKALREVLSNLIDNALKYTPADGKVDIRVGEKRQTSQGEMLGIQISDTGPGIPPQDLKHLFERHYRGVQASTEIPGSGLGLAIAKELIEQMHGKIEVFSPTKPFLLKQNSDYVFFNTQDKAEIGTTFIVWLLIESSS